MPKVVTVTMNPAVDLVVEMDALVPEAVNKARRETRYCGGKGINVASVLALLGERVSASGLLGRENAEPFRRHCADMGMGFEFVCVDGLTRTNVKLAVDGHGATDINLPGLKAESVDLQLLRDHLATLLGKGDCLILSGSLPPGVPADWYAELIRDGRGKGAVTFLDASGEALRLGLEALPDAAKPNRQELLDIAGGDDVLTAARDWVRRGVGLMAVSLGSDGALLVESDRCLRAERAPVLAVNMVGAGDAFVAGMVYGRLHGWEAERALAFSTALSGHWVEKMDRRVLDVGRVETLRRAVPLSACE